MQRAIRIVTLSAMMVLGNWLLTAGSAHASVNGRTFPVTVYYTGGQLVESLGFDLNTASNTFGNFRCTQGTGNWNQSLYPGDTAVFYGSYNSQGTALYGYYTGLQISNFVIGIGYSSGSAGKGSEFFLSK